MLTNANVRENVDKCRRCTHIEGICYDRGYQAAAVKVSDVSDN